jgi:hypothetical protein
LAFGGALDGPPGFATALESSGESILKPSGEPALATAAPDDPAAGIGSGGGRLRIKFSARRSTIIIVKGFLAIVFARRRLINRYARLRVVLSMGQPFLSRTLTSLGALS